MKDNYKKAMEVWEVPEEFYEAAVPMYRGYEAELAVMFGRNPVSGQEICRLLKECGAGEAAFRELSEKCTGKMRGERKRQHILQNDGFLYPVSVFCPV